MADALILETSFLIDLEREVERGNSGPAVRFLEGHSKERLVVTPTVVGELAGGLKDEDHEDWQQLVSQFRVLDIDREVCWEYSRIYRFLRSNGLLIGANDLWIAATARAYDLPVVTRNEEHFQRVPGLSVISYPG